MISMSRSQFPKISSLTLQKKYTMSWSSIQTWHLGKNIDQVSSWLYTLTLMSFLSDTQLEWTWQVRISWGRKSDSLPWTYQRYLDILSRRLLAWTMLLLVTACTHTLESCYTWWSNLQESESINQEKEWKWWVWKMLPTILVGGFSSLQSPVTMLFVSPSSIQFTFQKSTPSSCSAFSSFTLKRFLDQHGLWLQYYQI